MINETCLLGCAKTRTHLGEQVTSPHVEQLLPLWWPHRWGNKQVWGRRETKVSPPVVSEPSPGHSQVPPRGPRANTGAPQMQLLCFSGSVPGASQVPQRSHRASPAVASGAFPHADGQDKTCTPDHMVLSPLIPTPHHLTRGASHPWGERQGLDAPLLGTFRDHSLIPHVHGCPHPGSPQPGKPSSQRGLASKGVRMRSRGGGRLHSSGRR